MTKSQEDFMSMASTVVAVLNNNKDVWDKNIPLTDTITEVTSITDEITDLQTEQDKKHTGITTDKKAKRTALESNMVMVGHILAYLATKTKNAALEEQVDFSPTDLIHLDESKLLTRATVVIQNAKTYSTPALPYGLTNDVTDALSDSYTQFFGVVNAPRVAIINVSEATDSIAELTGSLRTIFKKELDKGMMLYRDNKLYGLYQKARIIVDSPTNHLSATAAFTDADGKPLPDVKISIVNGDDKVLRKSSPMGNIRVQNLLAGDHVLVAEKPGYAKVELPFVVSEPDTTRLAVVMKLL